MRAGGDRRGSAADRRARKLWLLSTFGDGERCSCAHCGTRLTYDTVEADRIEEGGSYRRENLQPACRVCNVRRSNKANWRSPIEMLRDRLRAQLKVVMLLHDDRELCCAA